MAKPLRTNAHNYYFHDKPLMFGCFIPYSSVFVDATLVEILRNGIQHSSAVVLIHLHPKFLLISSRNLLQIFTVKLLKTTVLLLEACSLCTAKEAIFKRFQSRHRHFVY